MNSEPTSTNAKMQPLVKVIRPTKSEIEARVGTMNASEEYKKKLIACFERFFSIGKEVYENDTYRVLVTSGGDLPLPLNMTCLSVHRHDAEPVHSWTDLQAIKNQICGPECEGVELYPAESRLLNLGNAYHMFVLDNPEDRFPFGFQERIVS